MTNVKYKSKWCKPVEGIKIEMKLCKRLHLFKEIFRKNIISKYKRKFWTKLELLLVVLLLLLFLL